jgi:hypothetical protein
MTIWPKNLVSIDGKVVEAIAPLIISASRATDIPAFYASEFIEQLKRNYLFWTNPFNGKKIPVSLGKVQLIVFWTKNPAPLIPYLSIIDDLEIDYYFNFTLNDYEKEGFEKKLPNLLNRIDTFIELANKIGKDKLIWRFDPIILFKNQTEEQLLERIVNIAEKIHKYTSKLVFSFVDTHYLKVKVKLKDSEIRMEALNGNTKISFAKQLSLLLQPLNLEIATCAESIDLDCFGITHNKCIDDQLINNFFGKNKKLNQFISNLADKNALKDKGQRTSCLCIPSKDIGRYNTCLSNCQYCYANRSEILEKERSIFN